MSENPRHAQVPTNTPNTEAPLFEQLHENYDIKPTLNPDHVEFHHYDKTPLADAPIKLRQLEDPLAYVKGAAAISEASISLPAQPENSSTSEEEQVGTEPVQDEHRATSAPQEKDGITKSFNLIPRSRAARFAAGAVALGVMAGGGYVTKEIVTTATGSVTEEELREEYIEYLKNPDAGVLGITPGADPNLDPNAFTPNISPTSIPQPIETFTPPAASKKSPESMKGVEFAQSVPRDEQLEYSLHQADFQEMLVNNYRILFKKSYVAPSENLSDLEMAQAINDEITAGIYTVGRLAETDKEEALKNLTRFINPYEDFAYYDTISQRIGPNQPWLSETSTVTETSGLVAGDSQSEPMSMSYTRTTLQNKVSIVVGKEYDKSKDKSTFAIQQAYVIE